MARSVLIEQDVRKLLTAMCTHNTQIVSVDAYWWIVKPVSIGENNMNTAILWNLTHGCTVAVVLAGTDEDIVRITEGSLTMTHGLIARVETDMLAAWTLPNGQTVELQPVTPLTRIEHLVRL